MSILSYEGLKHEIAEKLKRKADFGDEENLISLGLTSLQILRLLNECKKEGILLSFGEIMKHPTLGSWIQMIREKQGASPQQEDRITLPVLQEAKDFEEFDLTDVQYAYWVGREKGQTLGGISTHAYIEFDGAIEDTEGLKRAWYTVCMHHPMLRVSVTEDGKQRVEKEPSERFFFLRDLRGVTQEEAEKELLRVREKNSHRILDLTKGEVAVLEVSLLPSGKTRMHLEVELLVADVQSMKILLRDLLRASKGLALPEGSRNWSFRHYLEEEQHRGAKEEEEARAYWERRMDTLPEGPMLPLRILPENLKEVRFVRREESFSPDEWEKLKALARSWKTTPAMLLLAAYATVIERFSENSHFLLNLPLFHRNTAYAGIEDVIADFTTLLLLEVDMREEKSFRRLTEEISARVHEDMEHSAWSGIRIQRELFRRKGELSGAAPVVFACNIGEPLFEKEFLTTFGELGYMISQTPQIWIDFQIFEADGGLKINWDTVDALFPENLTSVMFKGLTELLHELILHPQRAETEPMDALPEAEREKREKRLAVHPLEYVSNLTSSFFRIAEKTPSLPALMFEEEEISYGELAHEALTIAAGLKKAGEGSSPVAVMLPKGVQQIAAILGVSAAGRAYVPISVSQPLPRRERIHELSGIRLLITDRESFAKNVFPEKCSVCILEEMLQGEALTEPVKADPSDTAYIIFTSGSTGEPKGVEISHKSALQTIEIVNREYGISSKDRVLQLSNVDFDLSVYDIFGLLSVGGALVLLREEERKRADLWRERIQTKSVTVWNSVPILLDMLLTEAEETGEMLPSLRTVILSGDWIGLDLPSRLQKLAPSAVLYSMGGATEGSIWSNYYRVSLPLMEDWPSIPYGYPLEGQTYRVVDALGRDCPDYVKGELLIGGYGTAKGYVGREDLTKERFFEDRGLRWYRTGDFGRYRERGLLEFMGRKDHQIKLRGHRIELAEIESTMEKLPGIRLAPTFVRETGGGEKILLSVLQAEETSPFLASLSVQAETEEWRSMPAEPEVSPLREKWNESADLLRKEALQIRNIHPKYEALLKEWGREDLKAGEEVIEDLLPLKKALPEILTGSRDAVRFFYEEERALSPLGLRSVFGGENTGLQALLDEVLTEYRGRELRVLEYGGRNPRFSGSILEKLKGQILSYTIADSSKAFLMEAETLLGAKKIEYLQLSLGDMLPYRTGKDEGYDLILLPSSLHREKNIPEALRSLKTLCSAGGRLLVQEELRMQGLEKLIIGLLEEGGRHLTDFRREKGSILLSCEEWREVIRDAGFALKGIQGEDTLCLKLSHKTEKRIFLEDALRDALRERLPEYMIPTEVFAYERLPLTENGKLDRKAASRLLLEIGRAKKLRLAETDTEKKLLQIWKELFGREDIGTEDNYFALGGDSLLATRCIHLVRREMEREISIAEIFEYPSVSLLASCIERKNRTKEDKYPRIEGDPAKRFDPFPLTEIQSAYYVGRSGKYELGDVSTHCYFELEGENLDPERLSLAWNACIRRHDMMRVRIRPDGMQEILPEVEEFRPVITDLRHASQEEAEEGFLAVRSLMQHRVLPIDRWPLFDLRYTLLPGGKTRLHLSFDNMIFDGFSMFHVLEEWAVFYRNPMEERKPYEISFRDYCLAFEELKKTPQYEEDKDYWLSRLPSLPSAPSLPMVHGKNVSSHFHRRSAVLKKDTWNRLKARIQSEGFTPVVFLLGVFSEVLRRWSTEENFTLNLTQFSRLPLHEDVERLVGDFTSLTLLEVPYKKEYDFRDRLKALQKRLSEDLRHVLYGGVEAERELARLRNLKTGSVLPIVFTSGLGGRGLREEEWLGSMKYNVSQTPQVWLDHQVTELSGELILSWDSRDELFCPGVLDEMFHCYEETLKRFAEDDSVWEEKGSAACYQVSSIRKKRNETDAPVSEETLDSLFLKSAYLYPERPAVCMKGESISYRELLNRALFVRDRLLAMGSGRGITAVCMKKSIRMVSAVLGILLAGDAYLPIHESNPENRIRGILEEAGVRRVLIDEGGEMEGYESLVIGDETAEENLTVSPNHPSDTAYIIYTSGSTGRPKGVVISHLGAVNTILDVNRRIGLTENDKLFGISSLSFDLSVYDLFGAFAVGAALVLPGEDEGKSPRKWGNIVREEGVTVWNSVPAFLSLLLDAYASPDDVLPSLRAILMSGDWIRLNMLSPLGKLCPNARLWSLGGATEASIWSNIWEIPEVIPEDWESVPYGIPLNNQRYYVLNSKLEDCPDYVPGHLYIAGLGLAEGYYGQKDLTDQAFLTPAERKERIYATGDLASYTKEGILIFLGRKDRQVKRNGYRIELGEIDAAARRLEGVAEAYSLLDEESGRLFLAFRTEGDSEGLKKDWKKLLRKELPEYMIPDAFAEFSALPVTENGKVDRKRLLREILENREEEKETDEAVNREMDETEMRVFRILAEILGTEDFSPDAHFFELGGNSLQAIQWITRLGESFGEEPDMDALFEHPTVRAMAAYLKEGGRS